MNEIERAAGLGPTPQYRYADVVGDRLFVAGQVPHDAAGELVGSGDVTAQAEQCLANLFTVIRTHGFHVGDIHQLTIYVVGPQQNLSEAWVAIVEGFGSEVPPATLLGVNLLGHRGQLVELDATVQRSASPTDG
jgi:enamine deaminase RidA (YjgF/YER057c/UK114 family)